jgi:DNA uptake protein ComE-like DNA-binding protein
MKRVLPILLVCLVAGLSLVSSAVLAQSTTPAAPAAPKAGEALKKAVKAPLDLNTATEQELEALPGVGKPRAKKIVDGRPFKAPGDLVSKKILSQGAFDKIKHLVNVK